MYPWLGCGRTWSADRETRNSRIRVNPGGPSQTVLKYQLLFHDAAGNRIGGNAAILYLDAILMMGSEAQENGAEAVEAFHAQDMMTFNVLAEKLDMPMVLDELELAGRREICVWDAPFRERGAYTYLPDLEPIAHGLTQLIQVKALRQIEQGKAADALLTLRLGYEMSDKVSRDPTLVSNLVSLGIVSQMNDALARLMSRRESPNLYWTLRGLPARQAAFQHAMDTERSYVALSMPSLLKLRTGGELSVRTVPAVWRHLANHRRREPPPPIASRIGTRWECFRSRNVAASARRLRSIASINGR